ncbi:hypothetical protein F2Q69_00031481 [Brassica cretica]|uniref:Uncharacterized protein n=1 Tax=Brassica cretica TaxID=69181 RepID=A0A8S9S119_BRACR|nr:hypothetical protein F2Q69_00031481 [Brassica cretica]
MCGNEISTKAEEMWRILLTSYDLFCLLLLINSFDERLIVGANHERLNVHASPAVWCSLFHSVSVLQRTCHEIVDVGSRRFPSCVSSAVESFALKTRRLRAFQIIQQIHGRIWVVTLVGAVARLKSLQILLYLVVDAESL